MDIEYAPFCEESIGQAEDFKNAVKAYWNNPLIRNARENLGLRFPIPSVLEEDFEFQN